MVNMAAATGSILKSWPQRTKYLDGTGASIKTLYPGEGEIGCPSALMGESEETDYQISRQKMGERGSTYADQGEEDHEDDYLYTLNKLFADWRSLKSVTFEEVPAESGIGTDEQLQTDLSETLNEAILSYNTHLKKMSERLGDLLDMEACLAPIPEAKTLQLMVRNKMTEGLDHDLQQLFTPFFKISEIYATETDCLSARMKATYSRKFNSGEDMDRQVQSPQVSDAEEAKGLKAYLRTQQERNISSHLEQQTMLWICSQQRVSSDLQMGLWASNGSDDAEETESDYTGTFAAEVENDFDRRIAHLKALGESLFTLGKAKELAGDIYSHLLSSRNPRERSDGVIEHTPTNTLDSLAEFQKGNEELKQSWRTEYNGRITSMLNVVEEDAGQE